jgi:hypothetical protein
MDALRALKARSGLSYRDIAWRMSRTAPQHAAAKSTLASLFAQNVLPRRPGQLTALVDVLAGELNEPAEVTSRYLEAWSRLKTPRPGAPAAAPPPGPPQGGYRAPSYHQADWEPRYPAAALAESARESRSSLVGQLLPWLALLSVLSSVFSAALPPNAVSFWLIWIMFCWPVFLGFLFIMVWGGGPRPSSVGELPAEYLPAEYLRLEYRDRPRPRGWG